MRDMTLINPALAHELQLAVLGNNFGAVLLRAAQQIANVDEVYGFWQRDGGAPQSYASSSELADAEYRAQLYVTRYYRFDPVTFERARTPKGQGTSAVVAASDIALKEYRKHCFDSPALTAKYFFGWHADEGWYVLNFYARALNDKNARMRLQQLASFGLAAMIMHTSLSLHEGDAVIICEHRLARVAPSLTPRERQICARTLAGMDARAIEKELGISVNSVRTYRQRAYRRCGISSANELLLNILGGQPVL